MFQCNSSKTLSVLHFQIIEYTTSGAHIFLGLEFIFVDFLLKSVFFPVYRRSPISIAAAVIYIITQLSDDKKPLKGNINWQLPSLHHFSLEIWSQSEMISPLFLSAKWWSYLIVFIVFRILGIPLETKLDRYTSA